VISAAGPLWDSYSRAEHANSPAYALPTTFPVVKRGPPAPGILSMFDILMLGLGVALFALAIAYANAAEGI
jgi:hypothetical protein